MPALRLCFLGLCTGFVFFPLRYLGALVGLVSGGFAELAAPLRVVYRLSYNCNVICGFMHWFCLLRCLFAYHQSAIYRRFRVGLCVEFCFVLVLNHLLECRVKCTGYCRVLAFKGGGFVHDVLLLVLG